MFHDFLYFFHRLLKIFFFKVNDFVRDKFMHKDGSVPLAAEILAGGCVSTFCRSRRWKDLFCTPITTVLKPVWTTASVQPQILCKAESTRAPRLFLASEPSWGGRVNVPDLLPVKPCLVPFLTACGRFCHRSHLGQKCLAFEKHFLLTFLVHFFLVALSTGSGTNTCSLKSAAIALCFALAPMCRHFFRLPSASGRGVLGSNWLSARCIVKNAWNELFLYVDEHPASCS